MFGTIKKLFGDIKKLFGTIKKLFGDIKNMLGEIINMFVYIEEQEVKVFFTFAEDFELLQQAFDAYNFYQKQISKCDKEIEKIIHKIGNGEKDTGQSGLEVEPILGSVRNYLIHHGLHPWLLLFNHFVVKVMRNKNPERI